MKNETELLTVRIHELEAKRAREFRALKEQVQQTQESLKPLNLIKSTLKKISYSPEIKNNLWGSAIGIGTGFLSRKLLMGGSHNPIKSIIGTLFQFAIGNIVSKRAEGIKTKIDRFLHFFFIRRRESKKLAQEHNKRFEPVGLITHKPALKIE